MCQLNEPEASLPKKKWVHLNRSKWLLLALLSAFYSLIVLPGSIESVAFESVQLAGTPAGISGKSPSLYSYHFQHGWPFVHLHRVLLVDEGGQVQFANHKKEIERVRHFYKGLSAGEVKKASSRLSRGRGMPAVLGPAWIHPECWSMRSIASSVSFSGLLLNLTVYLVAMLSVIFLLELRTRRGRGIWQVGIAEALMLLLIVGFAMGFYTQAIRKQHIANHVVTELDLMGFEFSTNNVAPVWFQKLGGDSACHVFQRPIAVSFSRSAIGDLDDDEIQRVAGKLRSLRHLEKISVHSVGPKSWDLLSLLNFRGDLWVGEVDLAELISAVSDVKAHALTLVDGQPLGNSFLLQVSKSEIRELRLIGARFKKSIDWRTIIDSQLTQITIVSSGNDEMIESEQRLALEEAGIKVENR